MRNNTNSFLMYTLFFFPFSRFFLFLPLLFFFHLKIECFLFGHCVHVLFFLQDKITLLAIHPQQQHTRTQKIDQVILIVLFYSEAFNSLHLKVSIHSDGFLFYHYHHIAFIVIEISFRFLCRIFLSYATNEHKKRTYTLSAEKKNWINSVKWNCSQNFWDPSHNQYEKK